jgi:hypothetical protein
VVGENVEDVLQSLNVKGITFEYYDLPDMMLKDDVHITGDMKVAWFKDTHDNILNIVSE